MIPGGLWPLRNMVCPLEMYELKGNGRETMVEIAGEISKVLVTGMRGEIARIKFL